ncbi:MBL fold metallo-hydrolase [Gammaproteobacteria bacterium]|nr:MBL fold metallo-hydrolase [Gammaproteobacteria bacterium]
MSNKINYTSLFSILFLASCSDNEISNQLIEYTSEVEELVQHSDEFIPKVYSYENGIHIAIGYGIANSIMVEGEGGNIIIDAADSVHEAEKIYKQFKQINSNPIKAVIYTHNHGDHTFGASYYYNLSDEKPKIIAHETTAYYIERIMGILNPIISERSAKMFGTFLPEEQLINVGIGPYLGVSQSVPGYIKPDITFSDELKINIAGIDIELYHAIGETNDQLFVWLPEKKALMPGDNIYRTFPNLYTIRGTTHRDVKGWIDSLDHMRSLNPNYLYPSHTKALEGPEVMETLTLYRDAIQYVHDQTIRLMNQGLYPDQIVEMIELPDEIASSPFLKEFYGTIRWSVKSIFNGYLGWFNGNISELDPLSRVAEASRIAAMVGGADNIYLQLEEAINRDDMQWALQLSDHLIALEYKLKQVNLLRAIAAEHIGQRSPNPNKRNYFLSSAIELKPGFNREILIKSNAELLMQLSMDNFFNILSVSLNPEKVDSGQYRACFSFNSGINKTITLRNQIAEISSITDNCDLNISAEDNLFKGSLAGLHNPLTTVASGQIDTNGKSAEYLMFLSKFRN